MTRPKETRAEALRRLDAQADALEARTARTPSDQHGAQAMNHGYRLIAELIGGVLVGLALGAVFDHLVGTLPWGTIFGTLAGFGVSIWVAMRSARRLAERMQREVGPARDLPPEDEDGED